MNKFLKKEKAESNQSFFRACICPGLVDFPHSMAPKRQSLLPPQRKKPRLPLAPKPEEMSTPQPLPKGGKEQYKTIEQIDEVQKEIDLMNNKKNESRTEIKQSPPTIFSEEVRLYYQNSKFRGIDICQPSTSVCTAGGGG